MIKKNSNDNFQQWQQQKKRTKKVQRCFFFLCSLFQNKPRNAFKEHKIIGIINLTLGTWEWNLWSHLPSWVLLVTPVHRRVRKQWYCAKSTWNYFDWGRIVFTDEFRFKLCPSDNRRRTFRRHGQWEKRSWLLQVPQTYNKVIWSGVSSSLIARLIF